MEVIERDLFDCTEGVMCHQVNCRGVMGSGIALVVKNRWPDVFTMYQWLCRNFMRMAGDPHAPRLLGTCQVIPVGERLHVANVFGQDFYGADKMHTNYAAVEKAFTTLNSIREDLPVFIPYLMGCDRGGADFATYSSIVDRVCPGVAACKLPNT